MNYIRVNVRLFGGAALMGSMRRASTSGCFCSRGF